MQRPSPLNPSPHSSLPSSPVASAVPHQPLPFLTALNASETHAPQRRLLVPTVRHTRVTPRLQRAKTGKLTRQSRSGSLGAELQNKENKDWVSSLGRLHIVEDQLEIRGYQIYAVEKWVVERGRLVNVVSVHTGDPNHRITVTALSPFTSLSDKQAQTEFDNAVHILRRDGARPRETEHGVLLVTSLANFRSDYNLVHIPSGNFLAAREQLYVNINLLRMGCSGRTALTLHEPSEPTKDRFLSMYCFSESVLSSVTFNHCVLELVKLVQGALTLFGMFDITPEERNGLLCDVTAEGIQHWTDEVGEPMLSLEPMERVGDPSVVSALLSLVVTMRNKLQAIGITQTPKDPFQDLVGFMHAVTTLYSQRLASPGTVHATSGCLTLEAVELVNDLYERRSPEYRVPRMILGKLDEITTELNLRGPIDPAYSGHVYATADLAGFVQMILGAGSRDAVESLKALWMGKAPHLRKKAKKDGVDEEERGTDGKSTEEEDGGGIFQSWPKHMKIEGLKGFDFGLGRSKKLSVDVTPTTKLRGNKPLPVEEATLAPPPSLLPALVIAGESGAEGSGQSGNLSSFGLSSQASARSSNAHLPSTETPLKPRPGLNTRLPSTLSTASDPLASSREERRAFLRRTSAYEQRMDEGDEDEQGELETERRANRGILLGATMRRHSIDDLSNLRDRPRLTVDRMKIDVGLCGQYLIMRRREPHLQNIIALLQHLRTSLHETSKHLEGEMTANSAPLEDVTRLRQEVWTAIDAVEARCSDFGRIEDMLIYQTDQMSMKNLWRSVRQQRSRVVAARQAVFGAAPGTRPASGTASRRFFRVQATLDPGMQRLVDWTGRTESEVEEESVIPQEAVGAVLPPPYEELKAYADAIRVEVPPKRWWWPFGGGVVPDKGSNDETSMTVQA